MMPDQPRTYYDLFEVDFDATLEEIELAYHRMLERHAGDPEMHRQVKSGWATLGSERSRAEYDKRHGIDYLRAARYLHRRPPPTQADAIGGTAPKTMVLPLADQGAPKTMVLPPAGSGAPKTIVMGSVESAGIRAEPAPAEPVISVSITVLPPAGSQWTRSLPPGEIIVGRKSTSSSTSDIQLEDPDRFISRRHAALVVTADKCFVRDEHSANGTFVNGHQIPRGKSSVLVDGDRIGIEGYVLVVSIRTVGERAG